MEKNQTDPTKEKSLTNLLEGQSEQTKETSPEAKPEAEEKDVKDSQEESKENEEEKSTEDSKETLDEQSDVNKDNKNEEGDELFWGKFKTDEDAKKAYTNAERKITEQAEELREIKESVKSTESFLEVLNKAIESNPELHKQLEAEISKVVNGNPSEVKVDNIDDLIEKKLEQREKQRAEVQAKEEEVQKIVNFFKEHPDTTENDEKLGNEILDYIEEKNLPYTLDTVELVYTKMTQDVKTKEAVDKELNAKKVKDLERESATSVGKDGSGGGVKPKTKSSLSDLIGGFTDPNAL
jgi:hypothetical protein